MARMSLTLACENADRIRPLVDGRVQPEGIDQTRVSFRSFVRDATLLERGAGSGLDRVEAEDEAIVQSVQKGVRSRFYRRGRYSPTRERGLHHFHRLLCRFLSQAPEEQQ